MRSSLKTPDSFFGFQLGSDRKMARWDRIVEYLMELNEESDRIQVIEMGPSTEGYPFLLVVVSSPENLVNLDRLKSINDCIKDPRKEVEDTIEELIESGKSIVLQSMGLHASEIGSTQMAPELIYELVSSEEREAVRIREEVISLFIPCFNPDGQIKVTDWYNEYLDTEYEGCALPWLYHKYAGHDNNRDAFMFNLIESRYVASIMYQDWQPHAYQDHHEMGPYGARLWICPYAEPLHPHGDPLVWRELSWYGAHMAYRLEEANKTGVLNASVFPAWSHLGFHWMGNYHNIASMLTESAHAKLATPIYVHPGQLKGQDDRKKAEGAEGNTLRGFPEYKPQTNFPHPWPGGWWRLRDIVEQQKIAAWGLLDMAARNRDVILRNAYLKAQRQMKLGTKGRLIGYLVSADQHDWPTTLLMIEKLLVQGIEIKKAAQNISFGGVVYPAGSYWLSLNQPKMGVIKTLLGQTQYPDNVWTRQPDGSPERPYDSATDTIAEFMGVDVVPVDSRPVGTLEIVSELEPRVGEVIGSSNFGYLFDGRLNESYRVLNQLWDEDLKMTRVIEACSIRERNFPPGAFVVEKKGLQSIEKISRESGITFHGLERELKVERNKICRRKVGIYQRYWGGNMDEGWTRLVLEQFGFPFRILHDEEIKQGKLENTIDVLILPDDTIDMITGKKTAERLKLNPVPPEYRSGIGKKGIKSIRNFVENGGMLVCLNQACDFAIEKLDLQLKNLLRNLPTKDFFCPGSTLKARIEIGHPLTFGMPEELLVLFWNGAAFEILPSFSNDRYEVLMQYPDSQILQSGWLVGEDRVAGKAAMISARLGDGEVVLFGFRPQHRAQTHGTYKLLFNTLIGD